MISLKATARPLARGECWLRLLLSTSALLAMGSSAALAAKKECSYKDIEVIKYGLKPFQNPPEIVAKGGVLKTTLTVEFTDEKTTSIAGCPVKLRTYNGQLVGPTMRIRPGDTLSVELDNRLPIESPDQVHRQFQQESKNAHLAMFPASYNTTNLHTHGLHVSPTGNSDNVLLAVQAETKFPYEIRTPRNHAPGTFWYHSHAHGSTAIQVGSGMAGALILDDDPAKIPAPLREANKGEKVMVLQTTLYDDDGELNQITALFPSPSDQSECSDPKNFGTWDCSKRRVTINGQITPVITMRPGEVQRWRLIDAGFRQSFALSLESHDLHEIALDGLYLGRVDTWPAGNSISLQPGYRSDILVQASKKPGRYKLMDKSNLQRRSEKINSVRDVANNSDDENNLNVIAIVEVKGDPVDMALPTSAEMAALAPFPGVDLRKSVEGVQEAVFKLGQDGSGGDRLYFQVNYEAFDHMRVRKVVLGRVEQWSLSTIGDPPFPKDKVKSIPPLPHVFHIHVNPFQMVRKDPSGADELVWKDTLLVPPALDKQGNSVSQKINVYTHYTDYIGQFVLHCHILDHEDLGMMEVVEVVEPESTPMLMRMTAQ